jgi:hypothetical protein
MRLLPDMGPCRASGAQTAALSTRCSWLLISLLLGAACTPLARSPTQPTETPLLSPLTPSAPVVISPTPPLAVSPRVALDTGRIFRQVERLRGIEAQRTIAFAWAVPAEVTRSAQTAFLLDWPLELLEREVKLLQRFGLSEPAMELDDLLEAVGRQRPLVALADNSLLLSAELTPDDAGLLQLACAYDRLLLAGAYPDTDLSARAATCLADIDACLAQRALIEGDSALIAEQWYRTFGGSTQVFEATSACGWLAPAADIPSLALVPTLLFPERSGVEFARALFLKAGWAGVDLAYANPPLSSEQVLHPERYPKDTPRPPEYPDPAPSLGEGWTTEDSGTLGEWHTRLVLQAHLTPDVARQAAEGWDGDRYTLLVNPNLEAQALVLHTRWDSVRDAHEFSTAFRTYGENRFGPVKRDGTALTWTTPSGIVVLDVGNDQTLWIEAPDAVVADALREVTGFPLY